MIPTCPGHFLSLARISGGWLADHGRSAGVGLHNIRHLSKLLHFTTVPVFAAPDTILARRRPGCYRRPGPPVAMHWRFAGCRFALEVILMAVRSYRYELAYRDLEELFAERGVEFDKVNLCRWVQLAQAAVDRPGPCRNRAGDWMVRRRDRCQGLRVSALRLPGGASTGRSPTCTSGWPEHRLCEDIPSLRAECDHGWLKGRPGDARAEDPPHGERSDPPGTPLARTPAVATSRLAVNICAAIPVSHRI
jgi:hypothetical protein